MPIGGAIFVFSAKIGLKTAKNVAFCVLFRPMGAVDPLAPLPRGYATVYYRSPRRKKSDENTTKYIATSMTIKNY